MTIWLPWLVPALATGVAVAGRRRLPPGACAGLFVAGLSGLLLQAAVGSAARGLQLSAALIALAVLWRLAAGWVERSPAGPETGTAHAARRARRSVADHASIFAALLAWPALWWWGGRPDANARAIVLALVTLVALAHYLRRRGALARLALLAAPAVGLTGIVLPDCVGPVRSGWGPAALFMAAAAALGVVVGTVLAHWRTRAALGETAPACLLEPRPRYRRAYTAVIVVSCTVGALGVSYASAWPTPIALALAALAVLSVGHLWRSNAVGEVGLALTAETTAVVPVAWLPAHPVTPLLGIALAGAYMLWLARFWQQQLADGRPWTTAGRLIPAARRWAYVATAGAVVLAAWPTAWPAPGGAWVIGFTLVVLLALWSMLVRDPRWLGGGGQPGAPGDHGAAPAACFALTAASVAACRWLEASGVSWLSPAVVTGLAALLLALRVRAEGASHWPYGAFVAGVAPVVAAWLLARWAGPGIGWQIVLSVALVGGAIGMHAWRSEGGAESRERRPRGADATS